MVERIGTSGSLARAAIEAALKSQSDAVQRMARLAAPAGAAITSGAAAPAGAAPLAPAQSAPTADFARAVTEGLAEVDRDVKRADALALDVATGKVTDFHEVAAQLKQSELTLKFALEVRNKFIDAYREVMRMSV